MRRCSPRHGSSRTGSGRWRAATASAGTWRTGWFMTARLSSTCRRSCPRRCGCSPPATAARPTRSMRTPSRWPPCALPAWSRSGAGEDLVVMGMLADRRDELGRARTQVTGRLHRLLLELLPGGAKKFLSARQARALLASVRPRDLAGKTRRRLAAELAGELEATGNKTLALDKELAGLVTARGSTLMDLPG